jgi:riboflavin synthase
MFTGIVEAVGVVSLLDNRGESATIEIDAKNFKTESVSIGDSVATNGVCLTVTRISDGSLAFDLSRETLSLTSGFNVGDKVNLERSLTLNALVGGHLVTGHVDAVGRVEDVAEYQGNKEIVISYPEPLDVFFVKKGSVAINGVSLTINEVESNALRLNLIPHTLSATNLQYLDKSDLVNMEVDLVARYLRKMVQPNQS